MLRISVDMPRCIFCGVCEGFQPDVFRQEPSNIEVDVGAAQASRESIERTLVAAQCCPMECIKVEFHDPKA